MFLFIRGVEDGEVAAAAVFVGFDTAVKIPAGTKMIHPSHHQHQVIASEEPGQVITKTGESRHMVPPHGKENKLDAYHECIVASDTSEVIITKH